jgi:hypothetical protein
VSALFAKIGPGILMTHSQSGGPGWLTAIKSQNVKAIIAFEPGSGFVFPEGELPQPVRTSFDTVEGVPVPMADFMALTKLPIIIFYGDFIPDKPPRCRRRTPGAAGWKWHGSGGTPSTSMAAR